MTEDEGRLRLCLLLMAVATAVRVTWALAVPTIPVGDFAMYRESANYLVEHGSLDGGFIYMPGFVLLLAALQAAGGEVLSAKVLGALFGGLAAGPLFLLAARLDDPSGARAPLPPPVPATVGRGGGLRRAMASSPAALLAGVLYALWPGGVSLASVVGTDIPAAALLLLALAILGGWGLTRPIRPMWAAVGFGAVTGLAAYIRAVALPLTVLSAAYWLACGVRGRAVVVRTALAVGVTLLVLSPWAVRNLRADGELVFTDHHGGITALMGNYPNTEGTYARSLNIMFKELTGRTFLSRPHRETDRSAYQIARRWIRFDPAWTAGMVALRIERLFAEEHGLLYWSIYRPGVLPAGPVAAWFGRHRASVTTVTDTFYLAFALWVCAGLGFSIVERRWVALFPVACAASLAATYALFVAEPRYRVTTEVLLFPIAGLGLHRIGAGALESFRGLRRRARRAVAAELSTEPEVEGRTARWRRGAVATLLLAVALFVSAVAIVAGGRRLREGHRWAVSLWHVDGVPQLAYWRATEGAGARTASPVVGVPDGAGLRVGGGAGATAGSGGAANAEAGVEVTLPDLPSWHGPMRLRATLAWPTGADPAARLEIGSLVVPGGTTQLDGVLDPAEHDCTTGTAHLAVRLVMSSAARRDTSVVFRDVVLTFAGDEMTYRTRIE